MSGVRRSCVLIANSNNRNENYSIAPLIHDRVAREWHVCVVQSLESCGTKGTELTSSSRATKSRDRKRDDWSNANTYCTVVCASDGRIQTFNLSFSMNFSFDDTSTTTMSSQTTQDAVCLVSLRTRPAATFTVTI
jgi:hypothetical protein